MWYTSCWVDLGVHAGSKSKRLTDFSNISLKVTKCKKPPIRMLTNSFRIFYIAQYCEKTCVNSIFITQWFVVKIEVDSSSKSTKRL